MLKVNDTSPRGISPAPTPLRKSIYEYIINIIKLLEH